MIPHEWENVQDNVEEWKCGLGAGVTQNDEWVKQKAENISEKCDGSVGNNIIYAEWSRNNGRLWHGNNTSHKFKQFFSLIFVLAYHFMPNAVNSKSISFVQMLHRINLPAGMNCM